MHAPWSASDCAVMLVRVSSLFPAFWSVSISPSSPAACDRHLSGGASAHLSEAKLFGFSTPKYASAPITISTARIAQPYVIKNSIAACALAVIRVALWSGVAWLLVGGSQLGEVRKPSSIMKNNPGRNLTKNCCKPPLQDNTISCLKT